MAEVAGLQGGVSLMETPRKSYVRLFQRPCVDCGARYQFQRRIEGLQPSGGEIRMGEFLHDLC